MTPDETALLVQGWNEAQRASSGEVEPPTVEDFDALVAQYG